MTNATISPKLVAELFKEVQENAAPHIWSQGVNLTRGQNTFFLSSQSDDECVVHAQLSGRALNPKINLWASEKDWNCDCGDEESPCPHVCASVILLKRGELKLASQEATAASFHALHYVFTDSPEGLRLERWIASPTQSDNKTLLKTSLLSYKTGLQSGRQSGPDVLANKSDYAIDQILNGYQGRGLERARLEVLIQNFEADHSIFLDSTPIRTSNTRLFASYECFDEADGFRLKRVDNALILKKFRHGVALCTEIDSKASLRLMQSTQLSVDEQKLVEGEGSFWPSEKENYLFGELIPKLQKKISIEVKSLRRPQLLDLAPRIVLKLETELDTALNKRALSVLANIVYGDPPLVQLNYETLELNPVQGSRSSKLAPIVKRRQDHERQLMQKLARELNLQPNRRVQLWGDEAIEFVKKSQRFDLDGGVLEGEGPLYFSPEQNQLEISTRVSGENTFQFHVQISSQRGQEELAFETVFKAWQEGKSSIPLVDGTWAQLPQDWLKRYGKKIREFLSRLNPKNEIQTENIPESAELLNELGIAVPSSMDKLRESLTYFKHIPDYPLPNDLKATLRPYQKKGVDWLCFMRESGLGALLADDMGLGKTLQTLCALKGRSLVVAPTSVLFNWAQEIKKFRPSLKVSTYYGNKREFDNSADVVLTSYGLLRLDQEKLNSETWDTVVLDEAQTIKNPESQVARSAHSLRSHFRIALSGTPVENRLDDLWSQFAFVQPSFLGTRNEFVEKFARPISDGDASASLKLKSKIKPFILRRLKKDVALELPPKTETVLYCELSTQEREIYETLLASTRKEVLSTLEEGGNILKALEVILRLRQACCHSGLLPHALVPEPPVSSSKVDLLMDTLETSLAEGHKSLVFSQWTSFLDKIQEQLKARQIAYSRIDGSSTKRIDTVNEFQSPQGPPVMLISLKAGGVGLNLTSADHVFITDPWWNPAVEDQAADRAHRIGQQNPVIVHRLVAKESIEERILELQESKKGLAKAVLDEGAAALNLTRDDLALLLS